MQPVRKNQALYKTISQSTYNARLSGLALESDIPLPDDLVMTFACTNNSCLSVTRLPADLIESRFENLNDPLYNREMFVHRYEEDSATGGPSAVVLKPSVYVGAIFKLPLHFRELLFINSKHSKPFLIPRSYMVISARINNSTGLLFNKSRLQGFHVSFCPLDKDGKISKHYRHDIIGDFILSRSGCCLGYSPVLLEAHKHGLVAKNLLHYLGRLKHDFFSTGFRGKSTPPVVAWSALSDIYANEKLSPQEKETIENVVTHATIPTYRTIVNAQAFNELLNKFRHKYPAITVFNPYAAYGMA